MASELTVTIQASLTNGGYKETVNPGQQSITQAAIGGDGGVVSVGTSEEDMTTGDISTLGWLFITNLDSANYAGETHAMRLNPGITLRWQANTAAVKVKVLLLED